MKALTGDQIALIAARSRALGDGTRVRILLALARGEHAVGQIAEATGTQQSTVSKHLQVLFHAGLVERRRSAATVFYWLASHDLVEWLRYLGSARVSDSTSFPSGLVPKANPTASKGRTRG